MRVRTKVVEKDAFQWFENGDHPADNSQLLWDSAGKEGLTEGQVVRYFRTPGTPGVQTCKLCSRTFHDHGWIDTLEGGHIVCPGDWIITGIAGEHYPCKPEIFAESYEPVAPLPRVSPESQRGGEHKEEL